MPDLKELFFSKFGIYTNFDLNLDCDTVNEIKYVDEKIVQNNHAVYLLIKKTIDRLVRPYIFYSGMNSISALDDNKINISDTLKKRIEKFGLNFYLLEPLSTYRVNNDKNNWHCEYDKSDEIFIRARELDSIENFCIKNDIKSVVVNSAENDLKRVYEKKYKRLILQTRIIFWPFGAKGIEIQPFDSKNIKKKFWCGNKRYSVHRQIIASYLISRVPTEMLNLSWFSHSNVEYLSEEKIASLGERKKDVLRGTVLLDKISPITFDIDLQSKIPPSDNYFVPLNSQNTSRSYQESFCVIINETRFFQNTSLISEKIINPILNNKFFIIVGPPNTLKHLKRFGVKTFRNWIDESYDEELDHMRRLSKILDLIDYINSKEIKELQEMYDDMREVILHNLNLFLMYENLSQRGQMQKIPFDKNLR